MIEKSEDHMINVHEKDIRERICHILTIYHRISPSMMHVAIGSSIMSKWWKPILAELIKCGEVKEEHIACLSTTERNQTYTVLSLADKSKLVY